MRHALDHQGFKKQQHLGTVAFIQFKLMDATEAS
jgi:hypothetical protein